MSILGWSESVVLAEWAERECAHLDLIASWEALVGAYEFLGFTDDINDETRLKEFKSIIGEENKFLTRMRKGLHSAVSIEAAVEFLQSNFNTTDMSLVTGRVQVAYNKFKQRWISQSISALLAVKPNDDDEEGDEDGDR